MLTDICLLQVLLILTLVFFNNTSSIFSAWILGGLYLLGLGSLLLLSEVDILVGFLWIIDLGVGLVFLIFISYLFAFLEQKARFEISAKITFLSSFFLLFLLFFFFFLSFPSATSSTVANQFSWFFFVSWYDYYDLFFLTGSTELLNLREIYFHSTSFEFFLINFIVFYGVITCVLMSIVIKRSLHYSSQSLYKSLTFTTKPYTSYFFRSQNFIKQRKSSASSRVWSKTKTKA